MIFGNYNKTKTYLKGKWEMCRTTNCKACPLCIPEDKTRSMCAVYEGRHPDEAIATVRKWHKTRRKENDKL